MPFARPDLRQAALRRRRAAHQGDGRHPGPAGLHGRLPDHDRPGHLHHQRRRARRGQPAGALAGRLLHRDRGHRHRPQAVQRQGHPQPRRLARVRDDGQAERPPALGQGRSQAQARGDQAPARRRLRGQRGDARALPARRRRRPRPDRGDAREGQHDHPHRSPHRGLQEAAPRRPADRRQRREARREPLLQLPTLRPRAGRALQGQQEARRRRRADGHRAAAHRADHHPRGHRGHRRPPHRAQQRPRPGR